MGALPTTALTEGAIGGIGVAHGYLGRPGLTADARFVPDPYGEAGSRLYLTGDIVRRAPDGLEYLHRSDTQVKVRGYRVELGEVEAAMEELPGVTPCPSRPTARSIVLT